MKSLNYFPLDVESNIYSMTKLEFEDRSSKILVATLDCKIFCINYNKFKPQTREVEFTYIPNGAKISSIGALKRGPDDFVIGICHSLTPSGQKATVRPGSSYSGREMSEYGRLTTYYFNIYASGSASSNFDLDFVAQGCQTIRLRYVPYHLYQTELLSASESSIMSIKRKPFWLLSGGDNSIHAFCEDQSSQSFIEIPIEDCFPELVNLNGLALWLDVLNLESSKSLERAISIGFEDGSIRLYHSSLSRNTNKFELVKVSSFDDYTTITPSVRLFRVNSTKKSELRNYLKNHDMLVENEESNSIDRLNLLAVSSTNSSLVFEDVLNSGLNNRVELPESQRIDCSVSSAIGDTNLDGLNEIFIGTYGKELLTYQYDLRVGEYYISDVSELNHPIFAMSVFDLTGDALNDVVLLLASGVLVMQAAVKDVIVVCKRRLEALLILMD